MRLAAILFAAILAAPSVAVAMQAEDEEPEEGEGEVEDENEGENESENDNEGEEEAAPLQVDLLTQRMIDLVDRYYAGIGHLPTSTERASGLQSIQLMLLDGVSLARIAAATTEAIGLHTPGRRVPFEIAVPLRVKPADDAAPGDASASTDTPGTNPLPPQARPVHELDPEEKEARLQQRRLRSKQRSRLRLYRQWQARTKGKQTLIGVGVPLLASGYAIGFAVAGQIALNTDVPHYTAWVTAIPLAGNLLFGIWTAPDYAFVFMFTALEWVGTGLIIAGLFQKIDWPYKRDPTALKLGRKRDGRPAVTVRAVPTGPGAALVGRW